MPAEKNKGGVAGKITIDTIFSLEESPKVGKSLSPQFRCSIKKKELDHDDRHSGEGGQIAHHVNEEPKKKGQNPTTKKGGVRYPVEATSPGTRSLLRNRDPRQRVFFRQDEQASVEGQQTATARADTRRGCSNSHRGGISGRGRRS